MSQRTIDGEPESLFKVWLPVEDKFDVVDPAVHGSPAVQDFLASRLDIEELSPAPPSEDTEPPSKRLPCAITSQNRTYAVSRCSAASVPRRVRENSIPVYVAPARKSAPSAAASISENDSSGTGASRRASQTLMKPSPNVAMR